MPVLICVNCRHSRHGHSKEGCKEMLKDGRDCSCKVKYMDQGKFIMGEEKREW